MNREPTTTTTSASEEESRTIYVARNRPTILDPTAGSFFTRYVSDLLPLPQMVSKVIQAFKDQCLASGESPKPSWTEDASASAFYKEKNDEELLSFSRVPRVEVEPERAAQIRSLYAATSKPEAQEDDLYACFGVSEAVMNAFLAGFYAEWEPRLAVTENFEVEVLAAEDVVLSSEQESSLARLPEGSNRDECRHLMTENVRLDKLIHSIHYKQHTLADEELEWDHHLHQLTADMCKSNVQFAKDVLALAQDQVDRYYDLVEQCVARNLGQHRIDLYAKHLQRHQLLAIKAKRRVYFELFKHEMLQYVGEREHLTLHNLIHVLGDMIEQIADEMSMNKAMIKALLADTRKSRRINWDEESVVETNGGIPVCEDDEAAVYSDDNSASAVGASCVSHEDDETLSSKAISEYVQDEKSYQADDESSDSESVTGSQDNYMMCTNPDYCLLQAPTNIDDGSSPQAFISKETKGLVQYEQRGFARPHLENDHPSHLTDVNGVEATSWSKHNASFEDEWKTTRGHRGSFEEGHGDSDSSTSTFSRNIVLDSPSQTGRRVADNVARDGSDCIILEVADHSEIDNDDSVLAHKFEKLELDVFASKVVDPTLTQYGMSRDGVWRADEKADAVVAIGTDSEASSEMELEDCPETRWDVLEVDNSDGKCAKWMSNLSVIESNGAHRQLEHSSMVDVSESGSGRDEAEVVIDVMGTRQDLKIQVCYKPASLPNPTFEVLDDTSNEENADPNQIGRTQPVLLKGNRLHSGKSGDSYRSTLGKSKMDRHVHVPVTTTTKFGGSPSMITCGASMKSTIPNNQPACMSVQANSQRTSHIKGFDGHVERLAAARAAKKLMKF